MDLFCSGCRTEFKTQRSLSLHLNNSSYCGNKKRKYSSSPKTCKSTEAPHESNSSETLSNYPSNVSIGDFCSMNETTFDDTSLREKSSNNQKESEINSIDDDSISKQHETTASNQDENLIPDIHDPNKFFNDDWFNLLPSNDLLNQQSTFSQKEFLWTQNDIVQVSLLKLLHEIQAPLYAFDKIMSWAADAQLSGYKFKTEFRHRKLLMTSLYDRLDIHGLKPKKQNYTTHDGRKDEVITFDFRQSLLSLIRDPTLMSDNNMLSTGSSPYHSIPDNNDDYSEINTSERYLQIQSYKPLLKDEVRVLLLLYVD